MIRKILKRLIKFMYRLETDEKDDRSHEVFKQWTKFTYFL